MAGKLALRKPRSTISLHADHKAVISMISADEDSGVASRTVQRMVEREAEKRLGSDWRVKIRQWAKEQEGLSA